MLPLTIAAVALPGVVRTATLWQSSQMSLPEAGRVLPFPARLVLCSALTADVVLASVREVLRPATAPGAVSSTAITTAPPAASASAPAARDSDKPPLGRGLSRKALLALPDVDSADGRDGGARQSDSKYSDGGNGDPAKAAGRGWSAGGDGGRRGRDGKWDDDDDNGDDSDGRHRDGGGAGGVSGAGSGAVKGVLPSAAAFASGYSDSDDDDSADDDSVGDGGGVGGDGAVLSVAPRGELPVLSPLLALQRRQERAEERKGAGRARDKLVGKAVKPSPRDQPVRGWGGVVAPV